MAPRDTTTGRVLENTVIPALSGNGYCCQKQVCVGERLGGGKHKVDVVAWKGNSGRILVSLKWQQVPGTAEQKVPFEVICLAKVLLDQPGQYSRAYLVLGGTGWKLRDFYVSGGLKQYLVHADLVEIVTLERFVELANKKAL